MGLFDKLKKDDKAKISCVIDIGLLDKAAKDGSDKALPVFEKPFKKRVEECWDNFLKEEHVLRELIDGKAGQQAVSAKMAELLSPAFAETFAEVGYNGSKYELTLCLEAAGPGSFQELTSRITRLRRSCSTGTSWSEDSTRARSNSSRSVLAAAPSRHRT